MAKKNFKTAVMDTQRNKLAALIPTESTDQLNEVLELAQKRKAAGIGSKGRPPRKDKDNKKARAAERGTRPGEMRKTVIVDINQYKELERIAYTERIKVKQALANALAAYIDQYHKTH